MAMSKIKNSAHYYIDTCQNPKFFKGQMVFSHRLFLFQLMKDLRAVYRSPFPSKRAFWANDREHLKQFKLNLNSQCPEPACFFLGKNRKLTSISFIMSSISLDLILICSWTSVFWLLFKIESTSKNQSKFSVFCRLDVGGKNDCDL